MSVRGTRSKFAAAAVAVAALSLAVSGCQQGGASKTQAAAAGQAPAHQGADPAGNDSGAGNSDTPPPPAALSTNVEPGAKDVAVDTPVSVSVQDGTLDAVDVKAGRGDKTLAGRFNADKTRWTASDLLEPGMQYLVSAEASNSGGGVSKARTPFTTQALTLDQQTYPSLTPLQHETVGVGMPVIVQFDVPVHNRAAFERHMHVTAKPATVGTWHWVSDQEVHWRPKQYWKSGTVVHVDVDVNGVNAGNGIYGQMDRSLDFTIGQSVIMKADLQSDEMKVMLDGSLARTIAITGGKPGYETRSGTKLIVEKFESKRMDAATVGVQPGDPEYYNIPEVQYAQRVTFTGEFLHAAPWSVYAQGAYNVSHGCVGMSTEDGAWLFGVTHRGDPVEVTGTSRGLEDGNGWTDWNGSWKDYKSASAL